MRLLTARESPRRAAPPPPPPPRTCHRRYFRCACLVAGALLSATSGCQSILGIKDPVVGAAPDGAGGDASARMDGQPAAPDARAGDLDGGAGNPDGTTYATPTLRDSVRMVYDSARDRLVLFGGDEDATDAVLNDTWEWDGTGWTNVTPASGNPPARYAYMMAYDAARKRVVLFGGADAISNQLDDTWEWDGKQWTNVTPASGNPPARIAGGMVYDAASQRVLLFGGASTFGLNDTWAWDGTRWTNVTPATGSPTVRQSFGMAYDQQHDRVVVFGGEVGSTALDDTWVWDGTSWTAKSPAGGGPSARFCDAMAYDAKDARVVLFGGVESGNVNVHDTWAWDNVAWAEVTPTAGSPFGPFVGAYDSALQRVILYSGGPDMWAWNGTNWSRL